MVFDVNVILCQRTSIMLRKFCDSRDKSHPSVTSGFDPLLIKCLVSKSIIQLEISPTEEKIKISYKIRGNYFQNAFQNYFKGDKSHQVVVKVGYLTFEKFSFFFFMYLICQ